MHLPQWRIPSSRCPPLIEPGAGCVYSRIFSVGLVQAVEEVGLASATVLTCSVRIVLGEP
ncbi:hypothetical protein COMA2_40274 [Candidatus Nitrospira nitrificans]|uniref:Uncharacterized protein n=1 Tax=Candidatus Nitrospira nitrificans TaxID=1742973 RepID=A0A0S4LMR0_9BACT|nr:hypothetical protein COMA2_40274 [Candidatus Nitrospira nitrificans]